MESGKDRISGLPDEILHNIIHRLSNDEATQTIAISRRWETLWRSFPQFRTVYIDRVEYSMITFDQNGVDNSRDRDAKLTTLERLDRHERDFRAGYIHRNGMLDLLQQSLDKLSFANQAYQKRSIRSTTLEDEIHYQLLNFQMLHGRRRRNSIAAERRLLRETKAACPSVNCGSFEELNSKISGMNYNLGCTMRVNQRDAEKQFAVKLKQLELERETTIVNAAVNGGIWSLWVVQRESEVMRKGHLEVKAEIRRLRSELEVVDEEISCLLMKLCSRRLEKEALPSVCVSIVHCNTLHGSILTCEIC
ncbi:hypothetical protein LINPERPRIM_LOCUS3330 [Linum perenne]